jgi:RimJ/RimL family protein N-acetyltransferase
MLKGETITLRLVHESDLEQLYLFHQDIENRGQYFPLGVIPEPIFHQRFAKTGFWEKEEGMLLIVNDEDVILGHIEFFQTVSYLDELELSYHIYASKNAGKGIATEAVKLMTGYLFGRNKHNRIRLIIHPENLASRRVAEKCGYIHEGTARGAWYHNGQNHDVEVYALLRKDFNNKEGVS